MKHDTCVSSIWHCLLYLRNSLLYLKAPKDPSLKGGSSGKIWGHLMTQERGKGYTNVLILDIKLGSNII